MHRENRNSDCGFSQILLCRDFQALQPQGWKMTIFRSGRSLGEQPAHVPDGERGGTASLSSSFKACLVLKSKDILPELGLLRWHTQRITSLPGRMNAAAQLLRRRTPALQFSSGCICLLWIRKRINTHTHTQNPENRVEGEKDTVEGITASVYEALTTCQARQWPKDS